MTDDLVLWLRAQLDADERIARAAIDAEFLTCGQWLARGPYGDDDRYGNIQSELGEQIIEHDLLWPQAAHIATHDPARVLREIEAKRGIVDRYAWLREHGDTGGTAWVLPLLALPFADRPGFQESWRP